ncbi:small ribosomal subunit protein mS33 [Ahaetulla prasina]|uniref:small ribosomal subunit protein mS33 n=1 Tax=Ahaetulla prasina TaxID=499056 RepID=UPI0026488A52|nr:small ribosomal subunit protein mS33 [Ahaetulla prasina]
MRIRRTFAHMFPPFGFYPSAYPERLEGSALPPGGEVRGFEVAERRSAYVPLPSLYLAMPGPLSNYALRMARLSKHIFGEVVRPTDSSSMKVVKLLSEQPLAKRKEVYDWYPPHNIYSGLMWRLRSYGLYRDEHEDFKDEMKRLKRLRGKGPPKKGEGKRALKK